MGYCLLAGRKLPYLRCMVTCLCAEIKGRDSFGRSTLTKPVVETHKHTFLSTGWKEGCVRLCFRAQCLQSLKGAGEMVQQLI